MSVGDRRETDQIVGPLTEIGGSTTKEHGR